MFGNLICRDFLSLILTFARYYSSLINFSNRYRSGCLLLLDSKPGADNPSVQYADYIRLVSLLCAISQRCLIYIVYILQRQIHYYDQLGQFESLDIRVCGMIVSLILQLYCIFMDYI